MKYGKYSIPILLFVLLGMVFLIPALTRSDTFPAELPPSCRQQILQELRSAADLVRDAGTQDEREAALSQAGFPVLDTDPVYPESLANPNAVTDFWNAVCAGEDAALSLLRVMEGDQLRHLFFLHRDGQTLFFTTDASCRKSVEIQESSVLPVYDMELADWGIFYYRVYPAGDPHYVDYGQIRLSSVDKALYDQALRYVLPVGYQLVNLFLTDWQEGNWGSMAIQDTLESLYTLRTGAALPWESYPKGSVTSQIRVPADIFEETILPYFSLSREALRSLCAYEPATDSYPWQPIHGDDLTSWHYPMCEPEVTSMTGNPDGTVTLTVQVYSPDLKTDRLFCHDLTVRPLENGNFQYVSNRVTYVSSRGLPPSMARFELG